MKQSVYIVDDDPLFAQMLHDHITADGMRKVRVFHSGEECLQHLFEKPNTIILDYHLDSVQKSAANGLATPSGRVWLGRPTAQLINV